MNKKKTYTITVIAESDYDKETLSGMLGITLSALRGGTLNKDSVIYISIEEAERIE